MVISFLLVILIYSSVAKIDVLARHVREPPENFKNIFKSLPKYFNYLLRTKQMSIQVVDDEFDIVNIIKSYLQGLGLNVFGFTDPLLALEHFKINCKNYILVISDIRMPGMNGFEFVRKIREVSPAVKVLLMSAFEINSVELSAGLGDARIESYIQKPISLNELGAIVQKQLKTKVLS
ncbi:MAG TPA: response regulator [Nitrososphaeraceae archaeon]|nr:response regulator [Nitrososphaeraceae archaeon]